MKVHLTGADTLKIFEILLKHPLPDPNEQERILDKLKSSLVDCLEQLDSIHKENSYRVWKEAEEKRLEALKEESSNLKSPA